MSKTDKDRPAWVQNQEHGLIDHDHRDGVCIISDDQRDRWTAWRSHRRRCSKYVRVEYTCTKADPHVSGRYRLGTQTCWTWVCTCPIPDTWRLDHHGCDHSERVGCIGHVRTEFRREIPCVCDERVVPTCFPAWVFGRHFSGGVPSEFVSRYYHRPERAREREGLADALRRYNSGDDLQDFDFANTQARNSCRWLYW